MTARKDANNGASAALARAESESTQYNARTDIRPCESVRPASSASLGDERLRPPNIRLAGEDRDERPIRHLSGELDHLRAVAAHVNPNRLERRVKERHVLERRDGSPAIDASLRSSALEPSRSSPVPRSCDFGYTSIMCRPCGQSETDAGPEARRERPRSVAHSIASTAGWRTTAETRPSPTGSARWRRGRSPHPRSRP